MSLPVISGLLKILLGLAVRCFSGGLTTPEPTFSTCFALRAGAGNVGLTQKCFSDWMVKVRRRHVVAEKEMVSRRGLVANRNRYSHITPLPVLAL